MQTVKLTEDVPVTVMTDVAVVGGGPAGIAAAVAAARHGAHTTLIERYGFLGGMSTAGLVGPFMTSYDSEGKVQVVRGIFEEIVRRMEELGGAIHPSAVRARTSYSSFITMGHDHVTPFDPEAMKFVSFELARESGVHLLLHSHFVRTLCEDRLPTTLVLANKSGLQAIKAKVIVDCTGDGDVAASAGAPFHVGRENDQHMQPATMFFRIGGVNSSGVEDYIRTHPEVVSRPYGGLFRQLVELARRNGDWTIERDEVGIYETTRPGEWRVNTTRIQEIDGTDVGDLTRAEMAGRDQVLEVFRFLKKYVPGFQNAELVDTAAQIGIRETRHIIGEYVLTANDLIEGVRFPDAISCGAYPIDIHDPCGPRGQLIGMKSGNFYQIPYRSLVPLDVEQLLVAGRCISATHEAAAAIRVMPNAFATGQAAGTAAALSVQLKVSPREISVNTLRDSLVRDDVYLG